MTLDALRREIDWRLQNGLPWSAPVLKRPLRDARASVAGWSETARRRHAELARRYRMVDWAAVCTPREYQICCYVLDLLDRFVAPGPLAGRGFGLDVGAAAWSYLPALVSWSEFTWDGVEIDAHRRYWTLTTRRAHARYMMRRICPSCRYVVGSVLDMQDRYDCITWFLPFVRAAPLAAARLPRRYFAPQRLLQHALSLLARGGALFIVNQGEEEAESQFALLHALGAAATELGELTSVFSPFAQRRYGWLVRAPD
jgi:hypothetical protein